MPLSRTVMPHYPKYTTTVIGAYSVPRWYEPLDRLVSEGHMLPEGMAGAPAPGLGAGGVSAEDTLLAGGDATKVDHEIRSKRPPSGSYFSGTDTGRYRSRPCRRISH